MKINTALIDEFRRREKKLLAVTKYFDSKTTESYIPELEKYKDIIIGYGENRIDQIMQKSIQRSQCHFIGNIQSRRIKDIVKFCQVIHSAGSLKHLKMLIAESQKQKKIIEVFLQLQLDPKKQIGFAEYELINLLQSGSSEGKYCRCIGISGMGSGEYTKQQKVGEFQKLLAMRDTYFPAGNISAGTSKDYQIALEQGIDIIRIGTALYS